MNSRDGREGHAGDFRMVGEIIVGGSRQRGDVVPRDRAIWAHPENVANELHVQQRRPSLWMEHTAAVLRLLP